MKKVFYLLCITTSSLFCMSEEELSSRWLIVANQSRKLVHVLHSIKTSTGIKADLAKLLPSDVSRRLFIGISGPPTIFTEAGTFTLTKSDNALTAELEKVEAQEVDRRWKEKKTLLAISPLVAGKVVVATIDEEGIPHVEPSLSPAKQSTR